MSVPAPSTPSPPAALRALLQGIVDYAGLFPPAALDMAGAVRRYAAHRAGAERWMLGRFVVPAARLDEFAAEAAHHRPAAGDRWTLSALVGPDTEADVARVAQFNAGAGRGDPVVDTVEGKAATPAGIAQLAALVPRALATFVELPASADPAPLVLAARAGRVRAKLRTGGVTADAFPTAASVTRFLAACADAGVVCKLTAGLHHPLRGEYRLTYAPASARGAMFGFVNVFVAALLLREGLAAAEAERVLVEDDPAAFAFHDDALRWRDHAVPLARVRDGRERLVVAFGSCSFEEPVAELRALGWLA
jgi:hypothetical protein